ncbi:MAG TPA: glycoside hydrolase [Allosphingosinicella sp.]|nr:glycoside hydrolase [Allosphingosinicella sp.]
MLCITLALAAAGCAPLRAGPPATLRLDPFYRQHVDAAGIPVVGSAQVPASALAVARDVVVAMLAHRADIRSDLVRSGARVVVIAEEEGMTDLPEYRHWRRPARDDPRLTACERDEYDVRIAPLTDAQYWNARARGSGGNPVSVGAENLLARPGTRFYGENILIHEFSHAMLGSVRRVDPGLFARVRTAFAGATAAGKWRGDYAAVTVDEYWAEGTQFWFESNMISRLDDGTILSADDLRRYDPALAALLAEAYGPRHRIAADPFHGHTARLDVPPGRRSADCT